MAMKITARKAVDPIIATLLLIAIAVAAGIIVYVYVNSLAGGLTQGGGVQVSDQISLDAYNYKTIPSGPTITIRDVGSSTITISQIFFDGQVATVTGGACATTPSTNPIPPTGTCTFTITSGAAEAVTSGTSHTVKILDSIGGTATMTVIAGRSG